MFDASDERYDPSVRLLHLNQACANLSKEYKPWFDETVIDVAFVPSSEEPEAVNIGAISLDRFVGGAALTFEAPKFFLIMEESGAIKTKMEQLDHKKLILTYGDITGDALSYSVYADRVYIRPIPVVSTTFRMAFRGNPVYISAGQNGWLKYAPYAVIYKACEYGCTYLLEDERLTLFQTLRVEEAMKVGISQGESERDATDIAEEP